MASDYVAFDEAYEMGDDLLAEFTSYWEGQRITHYMCCPDKKIPVTCGFHYDGSTCQCFGSMCSPCLAKALGWDIS